MYACSIWGIDCNICCCRLRHCRNFCCEVKACKCELHPCSWVESYIHSNCRIIYCCKTCSSLKSSLGFFCFSNKPCCSWHICREICFVCDAKWKVKCALLLLQLLLPLLNCTWILVLLEVMLYDYKWTIHGRRPRHADVIGDRIHVIKSFRINSSTWSCTISFFFGFVWWCWVLDKLLHEMRSIWCFYLQFCYFWNCTWS